MTSTLALDFIDDVIDGPCRSVWAGMAKCVEEVGKSDNACLEWNVLTSNFSGIAIALPLFVMRKCNALGHSNELRLSA